eukprot:5668305-Pyramimonas_sp.AAC.1
MVSRSSASLAPWGIARRRTKSVRSESLSAPCSRPFPQCSCEACCHISPASNSPKSKRKSDVSTCLEAIMSSSKSSPHLDNHGVRVWSSVTVSGGPTLYSRGR